jgi:ATP-dependent DNA helicase RecG
MRIPPEVAIIGGEHDCRNRTLHKMFRLVGVGEQAGSGIPKIFGGWASLHWRPPALYECSEPYNQTRLELRMVDLLPEDLLLELRGLFGAAFDSLGQNERLALATAASEKVITHARVRELAGLHPFDATRLLQSLVKADFLQTHNQGRGAVYCLPGASLPMPEEVFFGSGSMITDRSAHLEPNSAHLDPSSAHLDPSSAHLEVANDAREDRNADGCLMSDRLDAPMIDSLNLLAPEFRKGLEAKASEPRTKAKIPAESMRLAILAVCDGHYVALSCLAELVDRDPDALRQQHLKPLLKEKKLFLAFPMSPNHAKQGYRSVK